jgi:hypothetical protein
MIYLVTLQARDLILKAHGRTVYHLIRLRENYFGNFTNFSTRSEYMDKHSRGAVGDPMVLKYRKGKVSEVKWVIKKFVKSSVVVKYVASVDSYGYSGQRNFVAYGAARL